MAIPIDPSQFSRNTGFEVKEDRGVPGKLDDQDVVVRDGSDQPVDWNEPEFRTARERAVRELVLEPKAREHAELSEGIAPGAANPKVTARRSDVESAMAMLREVVGNRELPADLRSMAALILSGFESQVAATDGKKSQRTAAFRRLAEAHRIDNDNVFAWGEYGMAVLGFTRMGRIERAIATSRVGVNIEIDDEVRRAVTNLNRFPDNPEAQVYLRAILADWVRQNEASPVEVKLLETVEQRLQGFRTDPEVAATIDALAADLDARRPANN